MMPVALKTRPLRLSMLSARPLLAAAVFILLFCTTQFLPLRRVSAIVSTPSAPSPVTLPDPAVPSVAANTTPPHDARDPQVRARMLADMPPCANSGTRAPSFLLVFMGHSGSTALITSLAQHSSTDIVSLEPVDHGIYVNGSSSSTSLLALQYTHDLFAKGRATNKTVGFKIRPRHLQARPTDFSDLIRKADTRIIWNYRTNLFKQAVGDYAIHYKGDRSSYEGLKVDAEGNEEGKPSASRVDKFAIHDMDVLHKLLKSRVYGEDQVSRALHQISPDGCVLPVSYESYLRHPEATLERIHTFLGLNTAEMHPALRKKATSDSVCDVIENWREVCEAFFGCVQWRWMLDDFENGCSCSQLQPSRFKMNMKYCSLT